MDFKFGFEGNGDNSPTLVLTCTISVCSQIGQEESEGGGQEARTGGGPEDGRREALGETQGMSR